MNTKLVPRTFPELMKLANLEGANKDLCWKVHDNVQSFVLHLNTMHELYTHLLVTQSEVNSCCVACTVKSERKHTTKNFVRVITISHLVLTMT